MRTDVKIREDGLQLEENRRFHEWFWRIERITWVCFGCLVLAALLGLAGAGGALSTAHVTLSNAEMEYPRVARWERPTEITATFSPSYQGPLALALGSGFTSSFALEDVQPKPFEVLLQDGREEFRFQGSSDGERKVVFTIKPKHPGRASFTASIAGTEEVLTTWIWP